MTNSLDTAPAAALQESALVGYITLYSTMNGRWPSVIQDVTREACICAVAGSALAVPSFYFTL